MRKSGIIMHLSSIPSNYGIGTLGDEAYKFADRLKDSGVKVWQLLPINPTGYGDSPYQSASVFAGNPYFIDLDLLGEAGLIPRSVLDALGEATEEREKRCVDYAKIWATKSNILKIAYMSGYRKDGVRVKIFAEENREWIYDYALYMALKEHFRQAPWYEWEAKARNRDKKALDEYRELLDSEITFHIYVQYLFFEQYKNFKNYVNSLGITLLGDLPIYCAYDSADVWAHRKLFLLDADNKPTLVAGVPPDYFSEDGQLWGNPLYNWERMKRASYKWWLDRVGVASRLFDSIRIDHFRGLESYFAIPYGDENARGGHWEKGPSISFINAIRRKYPKLEIIAEDLGTLTDEVYELMNRAKLPGMKVLQFAFNVGSDSTYLPHKYERNCVCYTGTHDNNTLEGWLASLSQTDFEYLRDYAGLNEREGYAAGVIRLGMSSRADLFIAQMQDYLELGEEHRMNVPSRPSGNWCFRMKRDEFTDELCRKIKRLCDLFGR